PLRITAGGFALLVGQRPLAGGELRRGQRARRGLRPSLLRGGAHGGCRWRGAGARTAGARAAGLLCGCGLARRRRALLAHLDLHDLGTAMAEALPHRAGIDGTAALQPPDGPEGEPSLVRVLIVRLAHSSRTPRWRRSAGPTLSSLTWERDSRAPTLPPRTITPQPPCRSRP